MTLVNPVGPKSKTTAKKINELGVRVNPRYLQYKSKDRTVIVRDQIKGLYTKVHVGELDGDLKATFYAAAGMRNYMMKHEKIPGAKARAHILKRAGHTHKNRKYWLKKTGEENSFKKKIELVKDIETKVDLNIDNITRVNQYAKGKTEDEIKKLGLTIGAKGLVYNEVRDRYYIRVRTSSKGATKAIVTNLKASMAKDKKSLFLMADEVKSITTKTKKPLSDLEMETLSSKYSKPKKNVGFFGKLLRAFK